MLEASGVDAAAASAVSRRCRTLGDCLIACCHCRFGSWDEGCGNGAGLSGGIAEVAAGSHGIMLGFNFAGCVGGPVLFLSGLEQHGCFVNKSWRWRWRHRKILNRNIVVIKFEGLEVDRFD